jgi:hypothetical protein
MGARWYDPEIGHFISADTFVPDLGNPKSLDRFAYTYNNPIKYIDPSGHITCLPEICDYPYVVINGGSQGPYASIESEGPEVTEQMPIWTEYNPMGSKMYLNKHPGNQINPFTKNEETTKYRQTRDIEEKKLDGSSIIIGFSSGADSAIMYAEDNPVAGLILLAPTYTGAKNADGTKELNKDMAITMLDDIAKTGVRIVIVQDPDNIRVSQSDFESENIWVINYPNPHYEIPNSNHLALNTDKDLRDDCWAFVTADNTHSYTYE